MFINRRLYQFQENPNQSNEGILVIGKNRAQARKTGKTKESIIKIDTMTGTKQVIQYYDEFESLEADYQLKGKPDEAYWVFLKHANRPKK